MILRRRGKGERRARMRATRAIRRAIRREALRRKMPFLFGEALEQGVANDTGTSCCPIIK